MEGAITDDVKFNMENLRNVTSQASEKNTFIPKRIPDFDEDDDDSSSSSITQSDLPPTDILDSTDDEGQVSSYSETDDLDMLLSRENTLEEDDKSRCQESLQLNQLINSGRNPFSCDMCSFSCRNRSTLAHHKMRHSEDNPFHCKKCDFTCKYSSVLKHHQLVHSEEKPYSCDQCGYKCKLKRLLVLHLRRHEANEKKRGRKKRVLENGVKDPTTPKRGRPPKTKEEAGDELKGGTDNLQDINKELEASTHKSEMKREVADSDEVNESGGQNEQNNSGEIENESGVPDPMSLCDVSLDVQGTNDNNDYMDPYDLRDVPTYGKGFYSDNSYFCKICSREFSSESSMNSHMIEHNSENCLRCLLCSYQSSSVRGLKRHITTIHNSDHKRKKPKPKVAIRKKPITFICPLCSLDCGTDSTLNEHLDNHSTFNCSFCRFICTNNKNYESHVVNHADAVYKCVLCPAAFEDFQLLKDHHCNHHPCVQTSLQILLSLQPPTSKPTSPRCYLCSFTSEDHNVFNQHILNHYDLVGMKCAFCSFSSPSVLDARRHVCNHSRADDLQCDECDFTCQLQEDLRVHIKQHVKVQMFSCAQCAYSCHFMSTLQKHMEEQHGLRAPEGEDDLDLDEDSSDELDD